MMRFLLSMLFSILVFPVHSWVWNYKMRLNITLTSISSKDITNEHVSLEINTKYFISRGEMEENCYDVIFSLENDTFIDFWEEGGCNTMNTTFWTKVPLIPAYESINIFMYFNDRIFSYQGLEWARGSKMGFFTNGSCGDGYTSWTELDGRYFMGDSEEDVSRFGYPTHEHSMRGSTLATLTTPPEYVEDNCMENMGALDTQVAESGHEHTFTFANDFDAQAHSPLSQRVFACRALNQGGLPLIPSSSLAMFDGSLSFESIPKHWEEFSEANDDHKYLVGTNILELVGTSSGSTFHDHGRVDLERIEGGFMTSDTIEYVTIFNRIWCGDSGVRNVVGNQHEHGTDVNKCYGSEAANSPLFHYLNVRMTSIDAPFTEGMITFAYCDEQFCELPPLGWDRYDSLDGSLIRAINQTATTLIGTSGGVDEHRHHFECLTGGTTSTIPDKTCGGIFYPDPCVINQTHSHTFSGETPYNSSMPDHVKLFFMKRKGNDRVEVSSDTILEWSCHLIEQSNQSYVCGGHGECVDLDQCKCDTNYFGDMCDIYPCHGVLWNQTSLVCSGHGECMTVDKCYCEANYYGVDCNITTCFGGFTNYSVSSSNIDQGCGTHGTCVDFDHCQCEEGYYGARCNITDCFGILTNETENVDLICSNHGECVGFDNCSCAVNYTYEPDCSRYYCFGKLDNNYAGGVCSGHGTCVKHDECDCTEPYLGNACEDWSCYNISSSEYNQVCNERGVCAAYDFCLCYSGYTSSSILSPCDQWQCGTLDWDDPEVCSGRGSCLSPQECSCEKRFSGELCEKWSCNFVERDMPDVCSGHGHCVSLDSCDCNWGYGSKYCSENQMYYTIMAPSLVFFGMTGFVVLVVLGVSVSCCILMMCIVCILVFCIISGLFLVASCIFGGKSVKLKGRVKKMSKLKNFDLLLKEQELEEDDSIAHLRVNKSLFEIEFDEVKLEKRIGEGGSNSVVYKAKFNNRTVAFKVFKTQSLSSQHSYDEFEREVEILSSVSHPSILQFFGCSLKPPRIGIVMEFCGSGDLLYFLRNYKEKNEFPYGMNEKIRMMSEIVDGMAFLHSRKIIHRDLKLENVLVDDKEHTKIMDFGLSKIVDRMSQQKTKRIGTSFYMSPEIVTSGRYTEKCDVFSFSIMVYMMATENFFNLYQISEEGSEVTYNIELKVANNPEYRPKTEPLDEILSSYRHDKTWLKDVITKCWKHNPDERYSFKELSEIFQKHLEKSSDGNENGKKKKSPILEDLMGTKTKKKKMSITLEEEEDHDEEVIMKEMERLECENEELREKVTVMISRLEKMETENSELRELVKD